MSQHLFKWKHFESEFILLCIRWYLKYPLSYRMLVEMMQDEVMHMIRKGQIEEIQSALAEVEFINKIMGIST